MSQYEIRTAPLEPLYYEMLPNDIELYWSPSCVLVDLLLSEECVTQPLIGATIPRQKYVGAECDASSLTWYLYQICNTDVRLSVCLSHLFQYVPVIVSSWNFQELLPLTKVMSMKEVKVRGQSHLFRLTGAGQDWVLQEYLPHFLDIIGSHSSSKLLCMCLRCQGTYQPAWIYERCIVWPVIFVESFEASLTPWKPIWRTIKVAAMVLTQVAQMNFVPHVTHSQAD